MVHILTQGTAIPPPVMGSERSDVGELLLHHNTVDIWYSLPSLGIIHYLKQPRRESIDWVFVIPLG